MGYNEGINMHWERSYFAMNKPNIAVASLIYGDPSIPGFNYTNAVLRAGGRPFMVSNVDSAEEAQYIYDHFDGLLLTDREGSVVLKGIEGDVRPYNGTDYTYYGPADCEIKENTDGTVDYNFKLREDLKFSDGEPLTAANRRRWQNAVGYVSQHVFLLDGTLLENWPESNIFSIISSGDAVARVLPAAWGYHRNGCDRFLPATRNAEELADLDALGAEFGPTPLVVSSLATAEDTSALINIVAKFCVSRENFHQKYEAAIMDMIQCAFIRSEKEVVDGYILSDGEIVERLQSLSHMKEIDYWQIVGSVWAASTMSRPILERYGQNVPLLARQILIPVLAVGLCYGIETDVVQMVAQYIIRLLTARGELDSVLRAAFCHHPENYISLMEYYAPEEHGMEPFTRK